MPVWRVTMEGTIYDQRCQNVLHFQADNEPVNSEQLLATELVNNFFPQLQSLQNNNWFWRRLGIQVVSDQVHPVVVIDIQPIQGILAGTGAHPSIAGLFSIRTSTPGRIGRGRFYMPGVHNASIANGRVEANAMVQYIGTANAITARYKFNGPSAFKMCVCPRSNPNDFKLMANVLARSTFGLQRRRNIGVGV